MIYLVGAAALLGLTIKDLVNTIDDANKVNNGEFVDSGFKIGQVVPYIVVGAITVTGALMGRKHFENGINMFNEQQEQNAKENNRISMRDKTMLDRVEFGLRITDRHLNSKDASSDDEGQLVLGFVSLQF